MTERRRRRLQARYCLLDHLEHALLSERTINGLTAARTRVQKPKLGPRK